MLRPQKGNSGVSFNDTLLNFGLGVHVIPFLILNEIRVEMKIHFLCQCELRKVFFCVRELHFKNMYYIWGVFIHKRCMYISSQYKKQIMKEEH